MMKVNRRSVVVFALALCFAVCALVGVTSHGKSASALQDSYSVLGITVNAGGQTLSNVISNPASYVDEAINGMLVEAREMLDTDKLGSASTLIFTAEYPYTTTKRVGEFTEYTCESVDGAYKITAVNTAGDGTTYIKVGGFVLSVANSAGITLNVGDTVTLGGKKLNVPTLAVESDKGARIHLNALNAIRSDTMSVYYDYDFGEKTGTNVYGTEMAAVFDSESGKFVVTAFRGFGEGDHSGMEIPDNGFVLSSYGVSCRHKLVKNLRFAEGDKLSIVGFDYVRFGGEPVTYTYNYEYQNADSATDQWNTNPNIYEFEGVPFAAYRGPDQTILYEYGWSYKGSNGTGTNVYGFEVAVDSNGDVVERGVNVSSIPEGGFVLSGHGKGRDFIRASIPLGAHVTVDREKNEIAITTSLNSFYVNVRSTVDEILRSAQTKIDQLFDVDVEALTEKMNACNTMMDELLSYKETIEQKSEGEGWATEVEKTRDMMAYNAAKLSAEKTAYEILALSAESKPVAARAVWHRPTEKTIEAVKETVETYRALGINLIFVESFFNGYSMFRSENVPYHKDFESAAYGEYADYLSAFSTEATKAGIEVHAWVEDFYVGLDESAKLVSEHPDWLMYNNDGSLLQRNEGGAYIFIDPANPDVQDFLIGYYKELLEKNTNVKGLNLDYIRYPVSDKEEDTGYSKYSMQAFAAEIGIAEKLNPADTVQEMLTDFLRWGFNKSYNKNAEQNYTLWCEYRMGRVTDYVERIYNEIKKEKGIILSTAVFSSINESKDSKKQDWQTWFKKGWIDIATPMAYFDAATDVLTGVSNMILAAGTKCYYYTGLASSYRGLPAYENVYQIEASYEGGANGYVIFCSTQIMGHEDVQSVLKSGVNAKDAVLPHAELSTVLNAYFSAVLSRADRLYIAKGLMTADQRAALKAEFDKILAMKGETAKELLAIQAAVEDLYAYGAINDYANGFAARRMQNTLSELSELLSVKADILTPVKEAEPENPGNPSEPSDPSEPTKPSKPAGDSNGLVIILIVAAVVLLGAGAAIFFILKKGKSGK